MQVAELPNADELAPWKPPLRDVPHVAIETNLDCNIRCRACYNLDRTTVKPLRLVLEEIDQALGLRRADAITLLGGEPTLHPALVEIVRQVARRGVTPQLLTNGLRFLEEGGDAYLDALVEAGLKRVLLHVDEGQRHVHPDPLKAIHVLFARFERRGLFHSLAWTVYDGGGLPPLVREFARYPHFDGVLALIAQDPDASLTASRTRRRPSLAAEQATLARELGLAPSLYIPSNLDDADVRWLMYFYYFNARTGRAFPLSPALCRAYLRLHRRLTGRELFGQTPSRRAFRTALLSTLLLELSRSPRRLAEALRLLAGSGLGRALRFHYLVIQDAPEWDPEEGTLRLCYHCPDATVRNGRLLPVCLADRVSPLPGAPSVPIDWRIATVAEGHLRSEP
ncbi:MAG TPA: radical SAM protein [Vicinamibacteria bacterium]|nr:radical SAM protein [Vicinamibacteria bacterium]